MNDQIYRQWQLLKLLPRNPKLITVNSLQDKLLDEGIKVTLRTLQRDMNTLSEVFIGIDSCRLADHSVGWFWSDDAPIMNISGLTVNQALSFNLVNKYLTPLFPAVTLNDLRPFFEQAEATLESLHNNPLPEWPMKIAVVQPTQPLLPPIIKADIHKIVSEALLMDKQLHINYQRSSNEEQTYNLNPLGLVLRNGISYLIASKIDSNDLRTFALHRMISASATDKQAIIPAGFELQKLIDQGYMGFNLSGKDSYQCIKIKVVFDDFSIKHLYETRLSDDQVITARNDGNFLVTATVQETEQLFWWLLSFGFRVEVLEPVELREKMKASVKTLAEKYEIHA